MSNATRVRSYLTEGILGFYPKRLFHKRNMLMIILNDGRYALDFVLRIIFPVSHILEIVNPYRVRCCINTVTYFEFTMN